MARSSLWKSSVQQPLPRGRGSVSWCKRTQPVLSRTPQQAVLCIFQQAPKALLFFLAPALSLAAIWPDQIGAWRRAAVEDAAPRSDQALWNEYGLQESQEAVYASDAAKFTATAWRFQDSTGAMAAFEWQRAPQAKASPIARLAAETPEGLLLAEGNYLFRFEHYHPQVGELAALVQGLARVDSSPLPTLADYLPSENLVPNSERYILGPVSLEKFDSAVPPSMAAFHLGAEAQMGAFGGTGGGMKLIIFSYPTPHIAMQRVEEFQRIPGAMAKRSGPLVAAIVSPPDRDAAERLLALVRYQASIAMSEHVPTRRDNIGNLIVNIFVLTGVLLAFAAVAGLAFGGLRVLLRRGQPAELMIVLHLQDR